jgi:hypothetical protein
MPMYFREQLITITLYMQYIIYMYIYLFIDIHELIYTNFITDTARIAEAKKIIQKFGGSVSTK